MILEYKIDERAEEISVRSFLKRQGLSTHLWRRLKHQGALSVNGEPVLRATLAKLRGGDLLRCEIPESTAIEPEEIPLDIRYEDENLLVVNKPAQMLVHPIAKEQHGTLANAVAHYYATQKEPFVFHPTHRLDRNTTGPIVEKEICNPVMTIEEMRALLQQSLKPKRYEHSMRVYETALKMAEHYHADVKKVAVAALIHDCGRQVPKETSVAKAKDLGLPVDPVEEAQPILLHAKLGVYFAVRKYGISPDDTEVLDAIRYHSTGKADMSETAKIVFLADLIEPGRDFEGVEALREASFQDLDRGMFLSYENTIRYLLEDGLLIHPDAIAGYNQLAAKYRTEQAKKQKKK